MPGTTAEPPSVSLSFANNFWGKEDAGVSPLLQRMQDSKTTCDELKSFYSARAALEDEYARKLLNLARKPLGSCEAGTLRLSLDVVRAEVELMGKAHSNVAAQMKSELDEPLAAFAGGMKERRKIVQGGIEKLLKLKNSQTATVNKSRDKFEQDCLKIKGYLAQGHMVMGQEERKNKAKLEKTQVQLSATSSDYEAAIKVLEETTGRWNRDWKAACDKFQDLEEERIDFMKSSLWSFANIASTVCVSDDASCEKMRLSLEDCDVEKDICSFIREQGTGQEIPDPPKYIDFCRGDVNDNASDISEEPSYTVAQFPRSINPTIRSSSPQPSVLESHDDPSNTLAKEFGRRGVDTALYINSSDDQRGENPTAAGFVPSAVNTQQAAMKKMPDFSSDVVAQVPHDPYPLDGMTQFCRTGPPPIVGTTSDLSEASSGRRRSSLGSQSDYSHPSGYSQENSGTLKKTQQAPPQVVSPAEESPRKRGFFNSPFGRRKSKHGNEQRPDIQLPRDDRSPTKTYQQPSVSTPRADEPQTTAGWLRSQQHQSGRSPEPLDPNQNYQLNVGNNVFDVAAPTASRQPNPNKPLDLDPIAQALEDLREVTKQSTPRVSADRYAGMATPVPTEGSNNTSFAAKNAGPVNSQYGAPPPSYVQPMSRLGAPPPAHTSRAMQETTRKYTAQRQESFADHRISSSRANSSYGGQPQPRPVSRGYEQRQSAQGMERPGSRSASRPASPLPRDVSRGQSPNSYRQPPAQHVQSRPLSRGDYRTSSPSPMYTNPVDHRASSGTASPFRQVPNNRQSYGRDTSPMSERGSAPSQRMPYDATSRPGSSRGPESALQLANSSPHGNANRPMSHHFGMDNQHGQGQLGRLRTKSFAEPQNFTKDGMPILHYARAMYMYSAQIPEELGFAKGDLLAVLRLQDDGWWEAEVVGKSGRGLVPSNYLKIC